MQTIGNFCESCCACLTTGADMLASRLVQICLPHDWCRYAYLTTGADMSASRLVQICLPHDWCRYTCLTTSAHMPASFSWSLRQSCGAVNNYAH